VYWITLSCHQPDDPPQMTVTPVSLSAFAFMFTGLINSRIQSRHSNDFPGTFKLIDIATHLNEKVGGSFVPRYLYGSHDVISSSISFRAISMSIPVIS